MKGRNSYASFALTLLLLAGSRHPLHAHGGEDHGDAAPAPASTPGMTAEMLTTEGSTELFEVLLKYPVPETEEETAVRLFVADYATNRPIENAAFDLSFTPGGVKVVQAPRMLSPGVYEALISFPRDTSYVLVATVMADGRTDFVEVRNIYVGAAAERFIEEHGAVTIVDAAEDEGMPWLPILLGIVGVGAITFFGVTRYRRRPRASIARDPELMEPGAVGTERTNEPYGTMQEENDNTINKRDDDERTSI